MINANTSFLIAQAVASEISNDKLQGFASEYEQLDDEFTTLKNQMVSFHNQTIESYVNDLSVTMRHLTAEAIQLYACLERVKKEMGVSK